MFRQEHFNRWAGDYDHSISESSQGFPFEGYYDVLAAIQRGIDRPEQAKILDLGVGTGLLTYALYVQGATIVGVDFSAKMLEKAQEKMPNATFLCYDLSQGLPEELHGQTFDYVVSSYAMHHFPDEHKADLIKLLQEYLTPEGEILIADVMFATVEEREECRRQVGSEWDDEEYYITADEFLPIIEAMQCHVQFVQVSFCGGVLRIYPL